MIVYLNPMDYVVRNMPPKVAWWRPIARYRRAKIIAVLRDISLCPACAVTIPSKFGLPCGIHQNDFEKDVAFAMVEIDRVARNGGFTVDQSKIDEIKGKLR